MDLPKPHGNRPALPPIDPASLFPVMGTVGLGTLVISRSHDGVWMSSGCADIFGIAAGASDCTVQELLDCVDPVHSPEVSHALHAACVADAEAAPQLSLEFAIRRADGERRWVVILGSCFAEDKSCPRLFCFVCDVTERKALAGALSLREAQLRLIYENIRDVVYLVDVESNGFRFSSVNKSFLAATGLTQAEVIGKRVEEVIPQPSLRVVLDNYARAVESGEPVYWSETTHYPAGVKYGEVMVAPIRSDHGRTTRLLGTVHDVTERQVAEERLHRLAHYDPLTGLPNRRMLYQHMAKEMGQAIAHGRTLALLYLDLDRFKHVNDTFGHTVGDELLQQMAERILWRTRARDTVGRFGGDEFGIVADVGHHPDAAAHLAQNLIDELQEPFVLGAEQVIVTPSIGIAICPTDSCDPEVLIQFADMAMYHAKAAGRSAYRLYAPQMNTAAGERMALEVALRKAVERQEFVLHYQPVVDMDTGRWLGVEALLRWQPPAREPMAPDQFVPALEESGLIVQVGHWVIAEACRQLRHWQAEGMDQLIMAVNLSARQFMTEGRARAVERSNEAAKGSPVAADTLCEHLCACVRNGRVTPGTLHLELTESVLMAHAPSTIELLRRLRQLGLRILVDDFGTGYSSLAYLKRLPIDALKIDREFVHGLPDDPESRTITHAIITLAHNLGLKVVAEGVESREQLEVLQSQGCDYGQGFYFCRPMSASCLDGQLGQLYASS